MRTGASSVRAPLEPIGAARWSPCLIAPNSIGRGPISLSSAQSVEITDWRTSAQGGRGPEASKRSAECRHVRLPRSPTSDRPAANEVLILPVGYVVLLRNPAVPGMARASGQCWHATVETAVNPVLDVTPNIRLLDVQEIACKPDSIHRAGNSDLRITWAHESGGTVRQTFGRGHGCARRRCLFE